jgi:hypothetical protein
MRSVLPFNRCRSTRRAQTASAPDGCKRISHILQVPIAFFYEGALDESALAKSEASRGSLALLDDFVSSSEGLRLVQSFRRIESADVRRRILALVQEISDHQNVAG